MTLPNLPFDSTDPADLPRDAVAPSQLGSALQDNSQGKFRGLAAGRFPGVVSGTPAGDPAAPAGPLGFVVDMFANLTSNVANADPATIKEPGDLQPLIGGFFTGLPLLDAVFATLGEIAEALTGVEDGDSGDLGSWASLLLGRDQSLASRVARIENKIALGAQFFDDFNRGDNDTTLGNGWTGGGDGQPLGIHDQAAQIKRDLLPDDGTQYRICPQVADGDDFTVAMVVHPAGVSENPQTVLYARMNTAFTQGVCVRMRSGLTRVSRVTGRSGGNFTYTDIGPPGSKFYSNSATVEFKGEGTTLQVVIDGVLVVDTADTVHTIGAANRTTGFSAQCWTGILQFPQYSGGLASFAMRSTVALVAVQSAVSAANTAAADASTALDAATTAQSTAGTAQVTATSAAAGISSQYAVLSNHESRLTVLESGVIIQEFGSNGIWNKPAGMNHHILAGVAGGGSGRRPGTSGGMGDGGGGGGGQGGWAEQTYPDAALPASIEVLLGAAGAEATSDGATNAASNLVFRNASTLATILTAGGGAAGPNHLTNNGGRGFGSHPEWNAHGGHGGHAGAPDLTGGDGYLATGGAGGTGDGAPGNNGNDCPPGNIGPGSGGGGGAHRSVGGQGGKGGAGGYPGGGGGGGGNFDYFGTTGNGGRGGAARGWIISSPFA